MTTAFVDTGAWIAAQHRGDAHHEAIRRFFRDPPSAIHLVTSNLVIAEAATYLLQHRLRPQAIALHERTSLAARSGFLQIAWVTAEVQERAWGLVEYYDDQVLSLYDCTSAVLARQVKADYVVGFDRDFTIMGFELRP